MTQDIVPRLFQVIIFGSSVGKSTIFHRLTAPNTTLPIAMLPTMGRIHGKIPLESKNTQLHIFDCADDKYKTFKYEYCIGIRLFVLVYGLDDDKTLNYIVSKFLSTVKKNSSGISDCRVFLVGTRSDLVSSRIVQQDQIDAAVERINEWAIESMGELNAVTAFEVSGQCDTGINALLQSLKAAALSKSSGSQKGIEQHLDVDLEERETKEDKAIKKQEKSTTCSIV